MAKVPYKLYRFNTNGNPSFQYLPATNTPYGATPATIEEAQAFYNKPSGYYETGASNPYGNTSGWEENAWLNSKEGNYLNWNNVASGNRNVLASNGMRVDGTWRAGGGQALQDFNALASQYEGKLSDVDELAAPFQPYDGTNYGQTLRPDQMGQFPTEYLDANGQPTGNHATPPPASAGLTPWNANNPNQGPAPVSSLQSVPPPPVLPPVETPQAYTVQAGDTLSAIAKRLGVPMSSITGYRSGDPNKIFPGEKLTIKGYTAGTPPGITATGAMDTTKPIDLGGTTPSSSTSTPDSLVAGATAAMTSYDQVVKDAQSAFDKEQARKDKLYSELDTLYEGVGGRNAAQLEAEKEGGIPELKAQKATVNAQLKTKLAEYEALKQSYDAASTENQNKAITMNSIIGNERALTNARSADLNRKAAEVGLLQAQLEGLNGNIAQAQDTANRAVDLRFADQLEKITIKQKQLELIQDSLSDKEKVRSEALTRQYNEQRDALATKVANEKQRYSELLNIATNYPDAQIDTVNDTLEQANAKVVKNSKIYREKIRPPVNSSGGSLSILDVQRYNELFPNAGVVAGDTEVTANTKVTASNSPEAKTRGFIVAAKDAGNDYNTVVDEINNDATIQDKAAALKIAGEVYGTQAQAQTPVTPIYGTGNFAKISLDDELQRLVKQNEGWGLPPNTGIREELAKKGYPINDIDSRMHPVQTWVNSIFNNLFH